MRQQLYRLQPIKQQQQLSIHNYFSTAPAPTLHLNSLLPAGMLNHGNTCYLNAVLQSLLSLQCLVTELRGDKLKALSLSDTGVVAALQSCVADQEAAIGRY